MGRPKGSKNDARDRLLDAAGRGFRAGGFGGIGVDGLAREAGLTSGAFYAHFGSKAEAFRLAVSDGLETLRAAVEAFKEEHGPDWVGPFVDFYFGERMAVGLTEACAMPTFAADVARADTATRDAYEQGLEKVASAIAGGLGGEANRHRAWLFMSLLAGGAGLARAARDEVRRGAIIAAAAAAAKAV